MDDLIDAMARRHLASRRMDVCIPENWFSQVSLPLFRQRLIVNDEVLRLMVDMVTKDYFHHNVYTKYLIWSDRSFSNRSTSISTQSTTTRWFILDNRNTNEFRWTWFVCSRWNFSRILLWFLYLIDFLRTNPTDFNSMGRSRSDYYNRLPPDVNGVGDILFFELSWLFSIISVEYE